MLRGESGVGWSLDSFSCKVSISDAANFSATAVSDGVESTLGLLPGDGGSGGWLFAGGDRIERLRDHIEPELEFLFDRRRSMASWRCFW